jgi:hypothetical protein
LRHSNLEYKRNERIALIKRAFPFIFAKGEFCIINIPIWFYIFVLILDAALSAIITRRWLIKRERVEWTVRIDRVSKYWMRKLKEGIEECDPSDLPDSIKIIVESENNKETDNKENINEEN